MPSLRTGNRSFTRTDQQKEEVCENDFTTDIPMQGLT